MMNLSIIRQFLLLLDFKNTTNTFLFVCVNVFRVRYIHFIN